jgi:poly-gamma-glutamate capsule biosynthesis protein CapA/YwtB (metallophosphatase superfamily)
MPMRADLTARVYTADQSLSENKMLTILACGDVGVKRADCHSMFAGCASTLRNADIGFAQLESTISERGEAVPNAKLAMRAPPAMARAAREAGIAVMSFAGNHCLDFGYQAFRDTLMHAGAAGIRLCGAGEDLSAARQHVIVEHGTARVAFLAVSSILPEGYAAEPTKPGCAPMRALTSYEQIEHDQPGTPARCRTFAHREDLAALVHGVRRAREQADLVLVSLHWGIHMIPTVLADYQTEVAHALIDAGADAILGHHPHLLKGVEIYAGKPIFYSLGNFAIEQPHVWDAAISGSESFRHLVELNPDWRAQERYRLPEITRRSGMAKLTWSPGAALRASFLPAWIDDDSVPQMLTHPDPRFGEVHSLLERSSRDAGIAVRIELRDDELVLSAHA